MKRIWSLLLAAVLLCALCAPAMAQEEKITLEFWEMSYGNDDRYTETCEKLIAQYEAENPNVTINMTYQPWDNYYQLFLTAVSSGAAPDVASCAIDQPDLFAQMNEIQYLDSVIDEWKEEGIYSDYSEDMLNFFKYEGNQIAIPYMVGYRGFFYRTDYLEQAAAYADWVFARQIAQSEAEYGLYGHFRTYDSFPFSEKANLHCGAWDLPYKNYNQGAHRPHWILPLIELCECYPEKARCAAWLDGVRRFAYGYFLPACQSSPFGILPAGVYAGQGLLHFSGWYHGHAKIYGYAAALAEVEALCFPAAEAAPEQQFRDRLQAYAGHFWLMFDGETLISFVDGMVTDQPDLTDDLYENAALHSETGAWQMIFGVVTRPEYRKHGLAAQLLNRAIADARQQGRKGLVLTCKDKLVHYYAKFGFVNEGVSQSTHGNVAWNQMRLTF